VKVLGSGLAVVIEADLVELGELVVVTNHQPQMLDDAAFVSQDPDVCGSQPADQTDLHWFTASQIAHPGELAAHE
jgi:hypothetical protein